MARQFLATGLSTGLAISTALFPVVPSAVSAQNAEPILIGVSAAFTGGSAAMGLSARQGIEIAAKEINAKGVVPVAVEKFNIKDIDMTAQLLRARQAGAEAILTYGIGPELAQIANGMAKLGWKVPLIGSNPMGMTSFVEIAGSNAEGARMVQSFIPDASTPRRRAFLEAFRTDYNLERIGNPPSAQCYDALYLLAAALAQARSTDGGKIREALETLEQPVEGVIGTYRKPFTAANHDAFDPSYALIGEVRGGVIVSAYESDRPR